MDIQITGGNESWSATLYRAGLACPIYQNVLIPSIYLSIRMRFSEIFIWGADHSWLEAVHFNGNQLMEAEAHFYDTKKIEPVKKDGGIINLIQCFLRALCSYSELEIYSKSVGVKIWNCTSKSWITSFERKTFL